VFDDCGRGVEKGGDTVPVGTGFDNGPELPT
jgi:hypothetical protein